MYTCTPPPCWFCHNSYPLFAHFSCARRNAYPACVFSRTHMRYRAAIDSAWSASRAASSPARSRNAPSVRWVIKHTNHPICSVRFVREKRRTRAISWSPVTYPRFEYIAYFNIDSLVSKIHKLQSTQNRRCKRRGKRATYLIAVKFSPSGLEASAPGIAEFKHAIFCKRSTEVVGLLSTCLSCLCQFFREPKPGPRFGSACLCRAWGDRTRISGRMRPQVWDAKTALWFVGGWVADTMSNKERELKH